MSASGVFHYVVKLIGGAQKEVQRGPEQIVKYILGQVNDEQLALGPKLGDAISWRSTSKAYGPCLWPRGLSSVTGNPGDPYPRLRPLMHVQGLGS